MVRKLVDQMVNEFFRECHDIDLGVFVTSEWDKWNTINGYPILSLVDSETQSNMIRYLASNDLKWDEKFLWEINRTNIATIFQHVHRQHAAFYDSISQKFLPTVRRSKVRAQWISTNFTMTLSLFSHRLFICAKSFHF